jgi:hypothetical protein
MSNKHNRCSLTLSVVLCVISILFAYGNSNADEILDATSALKQNVHVEQSEFAFHALERIAMAEPASITPLTHGQLASIEGEGGRWRGKLNLQLNISVVVANNICVLCSGTSQSILAAIFQSNSN